MDRAKLQRRVARRLFTNCGNELEEQIAANNQDIVPALLEKLSGHYEELQRIQNTVLTLWLDLEQRDEAAMEADIDSADAYERRWFILRQQALSILSPPKSGAPKSDLPATLNGIEDDDCTSLAKSKRLASRKYLKLPSFELPTFDGQVKNWIGFWAQFRKIHEEALQLSDDDKMHYLLKAMEKGSPARELIESFPPCGKNYDKAISQLRQRFARDDLIIDYYVRELLQLVISKGVSKLSMRSLYDKLMTQILALESLGLTENRYAALLYPLVELALPDETLRAWNRSNFRFEKKENSLSQLLEFLKFEVESEERIRVARFDTNYLSAQSTPTTSCFATSIKDDKSIDVKVTQTCIWCEKSFHTSSECTMAVKMSLDERREYLKKHRACMICLRKGHIAQTCRKYPKCVVCGKRHYTLMCNNIAKDNLMSKEDKESSSGQSVLCQSEEKKTVLLQTLKINISNGKQIVPIRALIDSGAQRSFVKSDIVRKINLSPIGEKNLTQNLFGGTTTKEKIYREYSLNLSSLNNNFSCTLNALEQPKLCGYIPKLRQGSILEYFKKKGIMLNDCIDDETEISLLIGSDFLGSLLTGRLERVDDLLALETKLGWTIQGPTLGVYCTGETVNTLHASVGLGNIENFWNLESLGIRDEAQNKSQKLVESEVETFFTNSVRIDEDGRYEVRLPWKSKDLQANYRLALKRLQSTTSRLTRIGIVESYDEVFREWLESGIIEEVDNDNLTGHYLSHHAVIRDSSLTTKIRPVFDASALDENGFSLNSCLEKGVNLIELIPRLLVQFRKYEVGVTADIKKAFLQISLNDEDRNYLKFLWWRDIHESPRVIQTFRHRRVVFGVTTSPYLLAATILYHLRKYDSKTASLLRHSFYVDNCVLSVKNEKEMRGFVEEAKSIMLDGKFELRCWVTGPYLVDKEVLSTSVLGLNWDPRSDILKCYTPSLKEGKITKRYMLSIAQSTFDPLGFLCPATIVPKLLIQRCWVMNIDWDQQLPVELAKIFLNWLEYIDSFKACIIPRRISPFDIDESDNSLHVFCDGSQAAYACCIFLRSEYRSEVSVRLLFAKSRVAPTKRVTIPRIELLAALIASRLANEVKSNLNISCKDFYWTDSSIVLAWIRKQSGMDVFVQNRINEIVRRTNVTEWHHVPGELNPADLPSRGCNPKELLDSKWWDGPKWLYEREWLKSVNESVVSEDVVCSQSVSTHKVKFSSRLEYFGNYNKIVRMIGWCFRFISNCCKSTERRFGGDLSSEEFQVAERRLCKVIQTDYFGEGDIQKGVKLETVRSVDSLLCVKTRLTLSGDIDSFITPILLPSSSRIVERLVFQIHKEGLHAGSQTLLSRLRERFWILGGRKLVRNTVRSCIVCKRFSAKVGMGPEPPLPADRVRCGTPFQITGVDFAGPLILRSGEKCWMALFTCAVYRAVHLELCMSLSTEEFLLALRRFLARRGRVDTIYSDNGTNFRGAFNVLCNLDLDEITKKTNITWHFSPPASPWWGGFWERMVRTVKDVLRKVLGKASLNFQELVTVMCEVESVVNSRPLTYIADGTENFVALTPSHFLQFKLPNKNLDIELIDGNILSSRWRYLTKLCSDLKNRFRSEYLSLLVHKQGNKRTMTVKPGDVVIVGTDKKRVEWPLGIVIDTIKGADGCSRVAQIKTNSGVRVRSLQTIYPLELSMSNDEIPDMDKVSSSITTRSGRQVKLPDRLIL